VVADQEHAAAFVDQAEHQSQRAGAVGAAVDQVAELDDEAVRVGGEGEGAQVAVHVTYDPQAPLRRDT